MSEPTKIKIADGEASPGDIVWSAVSATAVNDEIECLTIVSEDSDWLYGVVVENTDGATLHGIPRSRLFSNRRSAVSQRIADLRRERLEAKEELRRIDYHLASLKAALADLVEEEKESNG